MDLSIRYARDVLVVGVSGVVERGDHRSIIDAMQAAMLSHAAENGVVLDFSSAQRVDPGCVELVERACRRHHHTVTLIKT